MNFDWNEFDQSTDPNVMDNIFLGQVYDILSIMCPMRKFKKRTFSASWINKDIFRAIPTRTFYVSLFKITRRNEHLHLAHIWRTR